MRILSCVDDEDDEDDEHAAMMEYNNTATTNNKYNNNNNNNNNNGISFSIAANHIDTNHLRSAFQVTFTPQQAHIFGGQSIFLSFVNSDTPLHGEKFYYVVFQGSKLQHITSAKVLNPYTLQAVIPDHDIAEQVVLSIHQCSRKSEKFNVDCATLATETFVYMSDSSQFLTQQLAFNVDNSLHLLNLQNVYSSLLDTPMHEKQSLDHKLTTSFKNLSLPLDWSLVSKSRGENEKSWTLIHFCAKYNLTQLAEYLLTKPGAQEALNTCDEWNRSPIDISTLTKHKKMFDILSNASRIQDVSERLNEKDKGTPTVKRHNLGTTTLTVSVTSEKGAHMKDIRLLMEYDSLGICKDPQRYCGREKINAILPLAASLRKLNEIKDEIERLRNLNAKERFDRLDGAEETFVKNLNNSIENMLENSSEGAVDGNLNSTEDSVDMITEPSNETILEESDTSIDENKDGEMTTEKEVAVEARNEIILLEETSSCTNYVSDTTDISIYIQDEEKPPKLMPQLSNISVNTVEMEEVQVAEMVAAVCEEPVQNVVEFVQCDINPRDVVVNDPSIIESVPEECESTGELSYPLESVTEETEEELTAVGTVKQERSASINGSSSLNDLPPLPKRVGVLRRNNATKKDRPLSDSFENLRMVEKQGGADFFKDTLGGGAHEMHHGHSLDTLTMNIDDENENEWSSMSVTECHGSQDSVSGSDSEFARERTDINKSFVRTRSLISLSDILTPRHSSEEKFSKKSFMQRLSFKKARSLTSLNIGEEKKPSKLEDRRNTVPNNGDEFDGDTIKVPVQSHHVRSESYDSAYDTLKKSKSSIQISEHQLAKDNVHHFHEQSDDEDTDEGTSHEIGEQHPTERKTSHEDKQKGLFSILTGKSHKGKKDKKKVSGSKPDPVSLQKPDTKKNLQKKGSFRYTNKHIADTGNLVRSASVSHTKRPGEKKSTDRKSPSPGAKFTTPVLEVPESGGDLSDSAVSPLSKHLSSSQTSLNSDSYGIDDDTDAAPYTALEDEEDDPDLDKTVFDDVESWSEFVDKKVLKKLPSKEIKRQDVIFELIKTEAQYVRVLQIMKKVYYNGMQKHLSQYTPDILNMMFPVLDELIELNSNFLYDLKHEHDNSENYYIRRIGHIILNHFGGTNGKMFRETYGYFCSRHLEAVTLYKELSKTDKKFVQFNRVCLANKFSYRLSVPECITRVTVRITKYPILIDAIIKAIKDPSKDADYQDLNKSLSAIKEILSGVDDDVEAHEQQKELNNLKKNLEKSVVEIKDEKTKMVYRIRAHKLFHQGSRLLYDKRVLLKSKTKNHETRMVILIDKIIFLQESTSSGKLHLLNVDNKLPMMSLKGLMIRENAADKKALFLMNRCEEKVELYEIIFENNEEKEEFMPRLEKFVADCPDEVEENLTDNEEDVREKEEERLRKIRKLLEQLDNINTTIKTQFEEKNRTVHELIVLTDEDNFSAKAASPCNEIKTVDLLNSRLLLEDFLSQINAILGSNSYSSGASSPCPGSQSNGAQSGAPPKKSDTFSGFENRSKQNGCSSNINLPRSSSLKPLPRSTISESDITAAKQRRTSQFIQVLTRSKTIGSHEDLASLSSASSSSLSSYNPPSLSELQVYQHLSVGLASLLEVTSHQDLEMSKLRCDMQEAHSLQMKAEAEVSQLREELVQYQKEMEQLLQTERDNNARLSRDLRRSKQKREQQAKSSSNEMLV